MRIGDSIFERFNQGKEGTIWYYESLAKIFLEKMPGPLSERLRRAVESFK